MSVLENKINNNKVYIVKDKEGDYIIFLGNKPKWDNELDIWWSSEDSIGAETNELYSDELYFNSNKYGECLEEDFDIKQFIGKDMKFEDGVVEISYEKYIKFYENN